MRLAEEPAWPVVVAWGDRPEAALSAGSWPFQLVFIRSQACGCGGRYVIQRHQVVPREADTLERHDVTCDRCQEQRAFWFDISSFHNDPHASLRFEELRGLFKEGMSRVEDGDLQGARLRFQEVAAREPWFGLAHYHLGMIAVVDETLMGPAVTVARRHLSAAAAILPMDPNVHLALADLWALVEDDERERWTRAVAKTLRALVGPDAAEGVDAVPDGE